MRILIAGNASPPRFVGGAELMAHEQAKALGRLGNHVRVFAGDLGGLGARHARNDDVLDGVAYTRCLTVPEDYSPEYLNFLHPIIEDHFRDVLREFKPDIVHCHNLTGLSVKLPMIARLYGAGTVCTLHDFWGFCLLNTAVRADGTPCNDITQCRQCLPRLHDGRELYVPLRFRKDFMRLALAQVQRFVAPSRYIASRYVLAGFPADRIVVVPNGVDTARFHPVSRPTDGEHLRITYAGYFGAHKGVATLLQAVALIPDKRLEVQLVGTGPERSAYVAQSRALGIEPRMMLLGKVEPNDMPAVYSQSDIVVLPSIWDENQPVCLMEAMAAGLPVVASRKGGIPELIDHGTDGLMFEAGDAADLAGCLMTLGDSADLRATMGWNGRRRVEELDHDRQAGRLIGIYSRVLDQFDKPERSGPVFAALGSLDREPVNDAGAVGRRGADPHLIPPGWVSDCVPSFEGVHLAGRFQRFTRRVRIASSFRFPAIGKRFGNAILRWTAFERDVWGLPTTSEGREGNQREAATNSAVRLP